ncbi:hypothetical protein F5I97DRAFT_1817676 [Phlebopus sp. FC_14]|nr:hypothetical protein F5I97DRAFT_1817676 [Phlebopus sp. FC_14]
MTDQTDHLNALKAWFSIHGGIISPSVDLTQGPFGISAFAQTALDQDTTIVTCPFSLIVTKEMSLRALRDLLGQRAEHVLETWSERQLICCYLCFHWLVDGTGSFPEVLQHMPYIQCLPTADKLLTALHFSKRELEFLQGTNLYGAALDRERDWRAEWETCRSVLENVKSSWATSFTWERYLTASTHLSSRAFPSSILSPEPSLVYTPSTYPVLLPVVDLLNHKRGQPVSWVVSYNKEESRGNGIPSGTVSIVSHTAMNPGEEIFNNYGVKANDELILGYGFALADNPDDRVTLQLGGSSQKWEIGRNARNVEGLWDQVRSLVTTAAEGAGGSEYAFEDDLEVASVLLEMVQAKVDRMQVIREDLESDDVRPNVRAMLQMYTQGQQDILLSVMAFLESRKDAAVEAAKELGIDLIFDEDDQDDC